MTDGDGHGDELDWLAAQFEPTGQIPKQKDPEPEPEPEPEPGPEPEPDVAPAPPIVTPPPAARPPYQPPPIVPRVASTPVTPPVVVPAPSTPPTKPIDPRGVVLPTAAVRQTPLPAPPAPAARVVPPTPADAPTPPPSAAGGFAWGLRPSDQAPASEAPSEPPVAPIVVPPVIAAPVLPPASAAPTPPPEPEPDATVLMPIAEPSAPPAPEESDATQLMDRVDPEPTQLILPPIESYGVSAAATELIGASIDESPEMSAESGIDALFGERSFREYDEGLLVAQATFPTRERPRDRRPATGDEPPTGFGRPQKILLIVAGALVGVLVLIALFLLGMRIPGWLNAEPVATTTPLPSTTPTPPPGPVKPGTYLWTELRGGECLSPFTTPWADEFTVVDCASPHPAQLVARGDLTVGTDGVATPAPFPGAEALATQTTALCSAPGIVNLTAGAKYSDLVIAGSYPLTQEQWDKIGPTYACFVSRKSGGPITGSLAIPKPVASPSPSPST